MFQKVDEPNFIVGEHEMLRFWQEHDVFRRLQRQNADKPHWSFLDGPITANNPMGVHHAWGRTYKDAFQRYRAMTGRKLRYQNGFDCQGLWVEVEVEKELNLGTKTGIADYGIDRFVRECKKRVLKFAARQTEQSIRLGYWMEWDDPEELRKLSENVGTENVVTLKTPKGETARGTAEALTAQLGNPSWGGSYFTFSTENNETIWTFLKKCYERQKIYQGHDVMPWSGRAGSAYSQMEVADGRKLTTHRSCFVRFQLQDRDNEYLLVWTTTPWTLTSNVACAVNPDLEYVKLRAKKDGAVYYFAKDNLEYKRLEKEFKEGFGRPEWTWPEGVGKLKTILQLFKEQGGSDIDGTIPGREMVGWKYNGPFDEIGAQQAEGRDHVVIDGGRDSKGNAIVVAGEGTGIVHIAPGCGDVDHQIGKQLGLPIIAPLQEDGTFGEGFGTFTGKRATDPETAQLVFDSLKEKSLLVAVETYPHIYPFCWRTGDELVFRLVDEWFINMDWREEIKDVVDKIDWLPPSIEGRDREREWLTNMRDWMISKKRFWGLALPIWVNPDDPADFEVIGSLAELQERAVAGWDEFEGHTPHRPWIDAVKIKSRKSGAVLSRIVDVGNPWLDAGIVPFSTLNYNQRYAEDLLKWREWYPPEFVVECFPGQFRNWFYSLLALSTMMRYDETTDPAEKRPFQTLLGHRLVMNEEGKPMHKSDGTAIWFEEAAEQLGVDTLRWLYLAQDPATDLRFGTRHKDEPVTLPTVDGPISNTREGLPCCRVTSKPADEIRRQILIPLWNSYAFFVNYARLDGYDPAKGPKVTDPAVFAKLGELDRWILSNLQQLIGTCRTGFEEFDTASVCKSIAAFIDDLSNWYIRRSRRRFWRSAGEGRKSEVRKSETGDKDKWDAYATLYEVLVTLSKLTAPDCAVPGRADVSPANLRDDQSPIPCTSARTPSRSHH
ncbi:MAG: class I tRNA ligase family protein [Planctomycetaceae bacterium]